ncbi:hypothetical protein DY000_02040930 [Brassica cretica]|uniref:Uncharacterized protein n=1 Tax=Brassica cretica TaxID=69181 RepID=A0ABQ7B546_BRACR|nr:hypothetical protein DY000_02040930 [Brassica cretica]
MLLGTASRGGPARCDPTELEPVAGRAIWLRVSSFAISRLGMSDKLGGINGWKWSVHSTKCGVR